MTQQTPPGWYDDGHGSERYWDGNAWTEQTRSPGGAPSPAPASEATQVAPSGGWNAGAQPYTPPAGTPSGQQGYQQPQQGYGQPQPGYQQPGYQQPGAPAWQQQPGAPAWQNQPYQSSSGGGGGKGLLIGLIGGGVLLVVLFLVLLFTVVLGGGSPEDVAKDYLDASAEGDVERTCELQTKDKLEDAFEQFDVDNCGDFADAFKDEEGYDDFQQGLDDLDVETEIDSVKENGDKATVEYTQKFEYTGDDESLEEVYGGNDTYEGTLKLVKEDGDWKVDSDTGEIS